MIYNTILINIKKYFKKIPLFIQCGNLLYYIYHIFFFFIISFLIIILLYFNLLKINFLNIFSLKEILLLIFIFIFIINYYRINTIFLLLIYSSLISIFITIYYLLLQAFDLAMTQICTETISTIFITILLLKTKKVLFEKKRSIHTLLSFSFCIIVNIILYIYFLNIKLLNPFELFSNYFILNNHSILHGKNILNLIVVIFRGYDTIGETFILIITTIFIYFILQKIKKK